MWRLLDLGSVDGYVMTNLYEAVGMTVSKKSSANTVILNHPEKPFVNIGYHQIMEKEIDVGYANKMGFDLVRRTVGGGAILDGPWEQDYFVIVHRDSDECPKNIQMFYEKFLRPPIYALKEYGLDAKLRSPNDILVGNKKISGNGAITIDETNILVGDILMELPIDLMMRVIKVPSEKFRDKLAESMADWLTSLENELKETAKREELKSRLIKGFKEELGIELEEDSVTSEEKRLLNNLIQERRNKEWIFRKDLEYQNLTMKEVKTTKIREGVYTSETIHKSDKLIRVTAVISDNRISDISISGDFFTQPYKGAISQLEEALVGVPIEEKTIKEKINNTFNRIGLKTFGVTSKDFIDAIMKIKQSV